MDNLTIQKAIIFAALKHKDQTRKTTSVPYIVHPAEVMQILTAMGCSNEVICAGILHDTLEDTPATPQEIKDNFGSEVLTLIQSESEDKSKTWQQRKRKTIEELKNAYIKTCLICFADKLSNLRSIYNDKKDIGDAVFNRFNASKQNVCWYYKSIGQTLKDRQDLSSFKNGQEFLDEYFSLLDCVFTKQLP